MVRFQTWTAGCLILIGAGMALFSPRTANSQAPQSVVVTNTATQPVPVSKSGTWNVGVSGTVKLDATVNTVKLDATTNTVKSAQSGLWNVGLTSAGNTVRVGNAKTSPVPVYNVRDAQTPFQANFYASPGFIEVPAGKRLVIEYVGIRAHGNEGAVYYAPAIETTTGGQTTRHYLGLQFTRAINGYAFFESGQTTRLYADPGTSVRYQIEPYNTTIINSEASISGYLVPYP